MSEERENTSYEFCITIEGSGADVDDAFQNALDNMASDPGKVIKGEVIYVKISDDNSDIEIEN